MRCCRNRNGFPSHAPKQIILGDRDQNATLARLQYYTRYLTQRDSRRQVREWAGGRQLRPQSARAGSLAPAGAARSDARTAAHDCPAPM